MKNRNGWSLHALIFALLLGIPLSGVSLAADCGDVNNSEGIDIDDCVYLIAYVFQGGPAPDCGVGPSEIGTVTDIDGNLYYTVKIGEQWWMLENLRVTHYRNGDAIPNVTDDAEWEGLSTGAYCDYDNDPANVATYGRLYNWYAVGDSRNIAPAGWHVPSDDEWQTLVDYLGGSSVAGGEDERSRHNALEPTEYRRYQRERFFPRCRAGTAFTMVASIWVSTPTSGLLRSTVVATRGTEA